MIMCTCGHRVDDHQTGAGPFTGFCAGYDCKCEAPEPMLPRSIRRAVAEFVVRTLDDRGSLQDFIDAAHLVETGVIKRKDLGRYADRAMSYRGA